ncbi:unnamed protein product [Mytilus coruscus]|uniref:Uncharacterized protein n=1 Tax=Mytilus coruscus TaxID=42192 RepID=A0A6J8DJC2_MYTCO|nr:unnamed protein product [Mytilus coruscus]
MGDNSVVLRHSNCVVCYINISHDAVRGFHVENMKMEKSDSISEDTLLTVPPDSISEDTLSTIPPSSEVTTKMKIITTPYNDTGTNFISPSKTKDDTDIQVWIYSSVVAAFEEFGYIIMIAVGIYFGVRDGLRRIHNLIMMCEGIIPNREHRNQFGNILERIQNREPGNVNLQNVQHLNLRRSTRKKKPSEALWV